MKTAGMKVIPSLLFLAGFALLLPSPDALAAPRTKLAGIEEARRLEKKQRCYVQATLVDAREQDRRVRLKLRGLDGRVREVPVDAAGSWKQQLVGFKRYIGKEVCLLVTSKEFRNTVRTGGTRWKRIVWIKREYGLEVHRITKPRLDRAERKRLWSELKEKLAAASTGTARQDIRNAHRKEIMRRYGTTSQWYDLVMKEQGAPSGRS